MRNGKVVHLSDQMHRRVREHCVAQDIPMRHWVEQVLAAALDRPDTSNQDRVVPAAPPPPAPPKPAPERVAVPKKPLQELPEETGTEPWALPPFWARG